MFYNTNLLKSWHAKLLSMWTFGLVSASFNYNTRCYVNLFLTDLSHWLIKANRKHNQPESIFWGPACLVQRSSCLRLSAEWLGYRGAASQMTTFTVYISSIFKNPEVYNKNIATSSTPIFGVGRISTHADPMRGQRAGRIGQRTGHTHWPECWPTSQHASSSSIYSLVRTLADSPADFWLLGEQSSLKCVIPCPGCWWTTVQNLTPLALSLMKKSVSVQIHTQNHKKNKPQTVTDISTPCLSASVDKKVGTDSLHSFKSSKASHLYSSKTTCKKFHSQSSQNINEFSSNDSWTYKENNWHHQCWLLSITLITGLCLQTPCLIKHAYGTETNYHMHMHSALHSLQMCTLIRFN